MTKLIILGSSTCVSSLFKPGDFRHPPGYLLIHNQKKYLIDCSEGIRDRLEKIKIDYYDIDTIFISHFHPDHFNLQSLIQSIQVRNMLTKKITTITVYGPLGIEDRFRTIWDATHYDGHYNTSLPQVLKIKFIEYDHQHSIKIDHQVSMTPYQVVHGNLLAFALRFTINQSKIFTYSGDSGWCDNLITASKQADYFLCEANEYNTQSQGHLNLYQVGTMAKNNQVKNLIITHFYYPYSRVQMIKEIRKSGYQGKINIASDLKAFNI